MTVHLFGATLSPGCANLALKSTANDFEEEFGVSTADFVRKDFYIDDGLKSVQVNAALTMGIGQENSQTVHWKVP